MGDAGNGTVAAGFLTDGADLVHLPPPTRPGKRAAARCQSPTERQLRELHFYPPRVNFGDRTRTGARLIRRLRHGSAPPARGWPLHSERGLARWLAPRYDGSGVKMHRKAGLTMTIKMRRLIVVVPVASVLLLANFLALGEWLESVGVVGWARSINAEYITGTTIAVIAAMVVLVPSTSQGQRATYPPALSCPVCGEGLRPGGRYCPACGSRA